MATARTLLKAKAGIEDLLVGQDSVSQTRNGSIVEINKINADNLPYSGDEDDGDFVSIKEAIDNLDVSSSNNQIATNTADIATNASNIAINASDIADNVSDIADNAANISNNSDNIDKLRVAGSYDFASDGGTQKNYILTTIPAYSTIVQAFYEIITRPTSGSSLAKLSLGVQTEGEEEILDKTLVSDVAFDVGYHNTNVFNVAANFTSKTTLQRNVIFTIFDEDLTAGKIYFWFSYITSVGS